MIAMIPDVRPQAGVDAVQCTECVQALVNLAANPGESRKGYFGHPIPIGLSGDGVVFHGIIDLLSSLPFLSCTNIRTMYEVNNSQKILPDQMHNCGLRGTPPGR